MKQYYLIHWGIKGQKWGVRRYQNKDGTLTPAGKKRYDDEYNSLSNKKKKNYTANPDQWVKDDISRSRKLTDESSGLARNMKGLNDTIASSRSKPKMDLSQMTDKEMRERINRAMLEKQYNDMFSEDKAARGHEYVDRTLAIAGGVLGVTSSALGIALAIKELKG